MQRSALFTLRRAFIFMALVSFTLPYGTALAQFINCCTPQNVTFPTSGPNGSYTALLYWGTVDLAPDQQGRQVGIAVATESLGPCSQGAPIYPDFLFTTQVAGWIFNLDLVINSNYYYVGTVANPRNPYLHECTNTYGMLVHNGAVLNHNIPLPTAHAAYVPDVFAINNRIPAIYPHGQNMPPVDYAVAGIQVVRNGQNVVGNNPPSRGSPLIPYGRTAIGIMANNPQMLIIVVAEQLQQNTSGVRQTDLADYLIQRGALDAVSLDGGGSTTLFYRNAAPHAFLTRPSDIHPASGHRVHRPSTSHLGFVEPNDPDDFNDIPSGVYVSNGESAQADGGIRGIVGGPVVIEETGSLIFSASNSITVAPNTAIYVETGGTLKLELK